MRAVMNTISANPSAASGLREGVQIMNAEGQ